jgi:hypothetical protein
MQVAKKHSRSHHKLQVLHVRICLRDRRVVIEHQQNAGGDQDKESAQGQRAQIPRGAELQRARADLYRKKMKKDILLHGLRAMQVAGAAAAAKYRAPDFRVPDPLEL